MRLSELHTGEKAYIVKVNGDGAFRKRILEMGFVRGQEVKAILNAPLKDPIKYEIMEYEVSLRRSEAVLIEISPSPTLPSGEGVAQSDDLYTSKIAKQSSLCASPPEGDSGGLITVALVGNPNAGKTSIFNLASGAREHVGNYSGVTVDAKEGFMRHKGYTIKLVDLPGTYSLSAYSPEELYVRKYIFEEKPDVIVNVVSASALERNLYLTTELIDLNVPIVIALNMYDELQSSGRTFDYDSLGKMLGIPFVPTVGKRGEGIPELLDNVIDTSTSLNNFGCDDREVVQVPYGRVLEKSVHVMEREILSKNINILEMPTRYICVKLLEGDKEIDQMVGEFSKSDEIFARRNKERAYIENLLREDPESAFTNARYGFIAGGLKETLTEKTNFPKLTPLIDAIVTNKYVGFPLFFVFMWIMFETTFRLGAFPMDWIEDGVAALGNLVRIQMPDGILKDLIVDGIIGGVGGVIVFLPNIVILYAFISFMEDSGYMARAAFIMDKVMHRIGLHGKSFIPLIMGFGCNVPAIMSTRTIESRNSRMITMLIVPFMSCSARLPVYLLLVGAFFSAQRASSILLGLYAVGILVAVFTALLFRKTFFKKEDTPFVMELPPYRMPTVKAVFTHMWDRSWMYLRKMGGIILIGSIVIWFLGYFPQNKLREAQFDEKLANIEIMYTNNAVSVDEKEELMSEIEYQRNMEHQEASYIGRIGQFIEPVMRPLGFDWKVSVSLLSGLAAKEIVVSTMGVLYTGNEDDQQSLKERLQQATHTDGTPVFTPLVVIGFLLFVLIYFPCIATIVAIKEESGTWKWAIFSLFYSTALAWLVAFLVFRVGSIFI
ncbi:MAG: ferrous iron transport protein B [Dysgonamonadaceae bacterium]|nr:ferrous iron transport protein B [Dysgonamonadaceae bacterium]